MAGARVCVCERPTGGTNHQTVQIMRGLLPRSAHPTAQELLQGNDSGDSEHEATMFICPPNPRALPAAYPQRTLH